MKTITRIISSLCERRLVVATLCGLLTTASPLFAQAPGGPGGRGGPQQASAKPYEVHAGRTVTFRLRAPGVTDVKVTGNFLPEPLTMKKDTNGVFSATTAPLDPQIYHYTYLVDGLKTIDPKTKAQ